MELAFTFPDPLNTTLFDSAAAPRGPSFTVHTHNCTTTIEKSVPTPVLAENEELGMDVEHVETLPVVRIHWREGGSSMCVGDDDWASERRIHAIMPRERWYANSRTFVSQHATFVWRDWPLQALELFCAKEPKPVAVLHCGRFEQWRLHVEERALDILDTVVVTGIVMLKKRQDRKRGHERN